MKKRGESYGQQHHSSKAEDLRLYKQLVAGGCKDREAWKIIHEAKAELKHDRSLVWATPKFDPDVMLKAHFDGMHEAFMKSFVEPMRIKVKKEDYLEMYGGGHGISKSR